MEENESASFGHHSGSASRSSQRTSGGGESSQRRTRFEAPRCRCGAYAILSLSSTSDNPNRLFFGCQYYKTSTPHCRFFAWLDECVPSFALNRAANREEVLEGLLNLEQKIVELERVVAESNSRRVGFLKICGGFFFFLLGIVTTLCFMALLMF
ncbi:hypothetical protein PIB30_098900 [Stylosanthes scabra]|uniref:GRF-type domain-containing protein n=1 Tax=Stylosanthes scabra TaxID=79078 RepID=A0ABU6UW65_9FABA|nr:hypothetical protein [Stylosanthes scabra]